MTCSRFTVGNPSRNSSIESPASKWSKRLFTGTRVPVKTGSPPRISGCCDTTLLTTTRIPHVRRGRKIHLRLGSTSQSNAYHLSIVSRSRRAVVPRVRDEGGYDGRGIRYLPRRSPARAGRSRVVAGQSLLAVASGDRSLAAQFRQIERRSGDCLRHSSFDIRDSSFTAHSAHSRKIISGTSEREWSERDERHGRLRREGSGRAQRELSRYNVAGAGLRLPHEAIKELNAIAG